MQYVNSVKCCFAALLLTACGSQPAQGRSVPALLAEATPETRAELQRVIADAMHGVPVTLADDAFTRESVLIIERNPPQDVQQRALTGRNLEAPQKFLLLLSDERCWLERVADGQRWELLEGRCVPAGG